MKKILAVLLTFVMICSLAVPAFAATETKVGTEVKVINWDDVKDKDIGVKGDFYEFNAFAAKIWIPEVMTSWELEQEDLDDGMIAYFATDDGEYGVAVYYIEYEDELEDWVEELKDDGDVVAIQPFCINGFDCIEYEVEEDDYFGVDFLTEGGHMIEFVFFPLSDDDFVNDSIKILGSFQAA